jgi:uncharacterized protein DUF1592/uncharacterized protein DUF1588/uncharacterized protein DUF1585
MKKTPALLLTAFLASASSACGSNHLLVGDNPDGSSPSNGGTAGHSGNGGTAGNGGTTTEGTAGSTTSLDAGRGSGTAGAVGVDAGRGSGSAGAAYVGPSGVEALKISIDEATTRITKVLWNSQPDAALVSQADQTQDLATVINQALNDPRAASGVGAFYRWWLNLDGIAATAKDATLFPSYTPSLQADMANETETFGVNVTLAMNGTFQTLMTAPFSFINADLAAIYGVSGVTGTDLRQVALDPTQRAGLLTQPGLQALGSILTRNDPSHRGSLINQSLLCMAALPTPPGVPPLVLTPGVTVRAALATAVQAATCGACHMELDPAGLAFETFDAIGRFRTIDNGAPVDVSGLSVWGLDPLQQSTPISGPLSLGVALANSPTAQECMTKQWLAFALGKAPADLADEQWMPVYQAFVNAQLNLKQLIVAVLTSDPFLAPN